MLSNTLKSTLSAALFITGCVTVSASAEDQEKIFHYASYFSCPGGKLSDADKIMKNEYGPVYDQAVKDGAIKGWGYAKHHTGGRWQRIFSHTNDSVDGLLKSVNTMNDMLKSANVDPDFKFFKTCNAHDDYIWEETAGNAMDNEGSVGITTYFQCDISTEDRADEIIQKHFASIYNANMGKNKINGWGWLTHVYGGKYRRAMTTSAANYTDLLKTMDSIFTAVYGNDNPDGLEFAKICSNHSDYLWNWK